MRSFRPLSEALLAVLRSNSWFADLPAGVTADLLARVRGRAFGDGRRIFGEGDPSDGIYGVLEGAVRVSGVSRQGREMVLDFYGPGSWFGEVAPLEGTPRSFTAEAHGPTLVLQLAVADLEELLATHAAFSRALLRLEAHRLRIVLRALLTYSTQTIEQRIASRLLMLAEQHAKVTPRGLEYTLTPSQETLARLNGITRQRVNQIVKGWETAGLIERENGRIVIPDRARLEAIVNG